jgi:hypothetical protein
MTLSVNDPIVVETVRKAFETYENALISNDVQTLQSFFWESPEAVRFGASEQLYGYEEIAEFRAGRVVNFTRRTPLKLVISTFGNSFASVMFEYTADINGRDRRGRQSQTWVQFEGIWKIISAHVSLVVNQREISDFVASGLAGLELKPRDEWLLEIHSNFAVTAKLAEQLMAFPLSHDTEPAPVYRP